MEIFTQEWADAVCDALNADLDPAYKASKLDMFWDWIALARQGFDGTWALGMTGDDERWVALLFESGRCAQARVTAGLPEEADFALGGNAAAWADILGGYDTGKAVMYRRLALLRGDVFAFFDRAYLWTEALVTIAGVPAAMPARV